MKKKIKNLIALLGIVVITASLSAQGIKFEHGTFQEALDKAKAENKLVFMDCYTSWCGPCKWLSKEIFPQKEVGDYFNSSFINVKMDMEKGEGPALMKKYPEVKAFPTLLFLDAEGKVLHVAVGGMEAPALIAQAKKAGDPMQRIDVVAKKYEDGDRSPALVASYVEMLSLKMDEDKAKSIGNQYLSKLTPKELATKENFKILTTVGLEYGSENHSYVLENKDKFITLSDKQTVERSLEMANYWYVVSIMRNAESSFEDLKKATADYCNSYPGAQSQRMERLAYLGYYSDKMQYKEYFNLQDQYILEDLKKDQATAERTIRSALNDVALNNTFAEVDGANEWAIQKANKLIELNPNVTTSYIALASVYKRMGDKEMTIKYADMFIAQKKKNGEDVAQRTMDLVNKLKGE